MTHHYWFSWYCIIYYVTHIGTGIASLPMTHHDWIISIELWPKMCSSMATWEGPQLLLAKVKNAYGSIGIFFIKILYICYVERYFFQEYPGDRVFQPVEPRANWTPDDSFDISLSKGCYIILQKKKGSSNAKEERKYIFNNCPLLEKVLIIYRFSFLVIRWWKMLDLPVNSSSPKNQTVLLSQKGEAYYLLVLLPITINSTL